MEGTVLIHKEKTASTSFTSAMSLTRMGTSQVPRRYVLPPSQRPNPNSIVSCSLLDPLPSNTLPLIDLASLQDPSMRSKVIDKIRNACKEFGFFQVINHGVSPSLMKGALDVASEFFNLPPEEKINLMSNDINMPVRYGTSVNHVNDKVHFWRDFLKLYSHPLSKWIDLWPSNPPKYKERMGNYAEAVHALHIQLLQAIFESLGLNPNYLQEEIQEGSQVMAVNCYPACPEPELALGMPPHSDYGFITILLQSYQGLEVMDKKQNWISVPVIDGGLLVNLGDHVEVISNGIYKSVVHRVTVNSEKKRLSIASLHSLGIEKKVGPAPDLLDEQHPKNYKDSSFRDFLDFLSVNDILEGRFIETLKTKA
ncbi:Oxoglutarate/iron-dependent dioxygenase [Macleaya cordata]|uniref:Oxoglutarate/iron-dependent dioxygenase n=1 Tax=Macleaya cordata TaxID=56857 RepID=A0A200QBK2_MACCD|nr:Oxoglutarate/iron-dependent dioxygenase [Macleaya cordata]